MIYLEHLSLIIDCLKHLDTNQQDAIIADYVRLLCGKNLQHSEETEFYLKLFLPTKNNYIIDTNTLITPPIEDNVSGIYAITCEDHIVYIGQSKNIKKRWSQHKTAIQKSSELKYHYLRQGLSHKKPVKFVLLEKTTQNLTQREKQYIKHYKPILNKEYIKEYDKWIKETQGLQS